MAGMYTKTSSGLVAFAASGLTKAQIGLDKVDNTSDAEKRIPTLLPATAHDLNSYVTPHVWHQNANAAAQASLNYPLPYAGLLVVHASAPNFVYQDYQVYGGSGRGQRFWRAQFSTEPWTTWREVGRTYGEDTDWVYVPPAAGMSSTMFVRRRNGIVQCKGTFNADVGGSAANSIFLALGPIPEGFRPDTGLLLGGAYTGASALQFQMNATTGLLQVRSTGATMSYPAAANFSIAGASW